MKKPLPKPVTKIHAGKQPIRRHFIGEWMEARSLTVADVVEALDVQKSQVYRWLDGQLPHSDTQERLAALFEIEPDALLRHPDQDWLARFFSGRQQEERERIKQAMELAWPLRTGTEQ